MSSSEDHRTEVRPAGRQWPPNEFEEYRLVRPIGKGGMGTVYLAHDTLLDRPVAVKFITALQPDDAARKRILAEARAAARLQHPNVVTIHRVGELDGQPYIVTEFVRGQSVEELPKPVQWTRVLEIGLGLARGLAAAHRRGVLHRDIKPANAIIAEDGSPKLLDFGLAKLVEGGGGSWGDTTGAVAAVPGRDDPTERSSTEAWDVATEAGQTRTATLLRFEEPATEDGTGPLLAASDTAPISSNSALVGTPAYLAPERWKRQPATRRCDIYSLGVLLYQLCANGTPFAESSIQRLFRAVTERDAPPLAEVAPLVEPRFAAIVDRCLRRDPLERFASGDELLDALEQLTADRGQIVPTGNPYLGLQPFDVEHRALFFGRNAEIRTVVDRLGIDSFVLVAGDSGVGKSSVCCAGVLPLVESGSLGGGRQWSVARMLPGRHPMVALTKALATALDLSEKSLTTIARVQATSLATFLRDRLGHAEGVLIFIDQLEEILTLSQPDEAAALGELLAELIFTGESVRLLGTVRGDYITRLASLPGIGNEIARALYLLRPLAPERIREAIVGPAHAKGVRFESDAMVDALVESAARAEGGLPLLQFALAELWAARDESRQEIAASALHSIGGVAGALARHADGVMDRMLPAQRVAARRVLIRLVSAEGRRVQRSRQETINNDPFAADALEALVRGRLIVAREGEQDTVYELAHEALLTGWDPLGSWLDQRAEARAVIERLEGAAAEWERLGRPREVLWGLRQLSEAASVDDSELGQRQAEFLRASRRAARWSTGLRRTALVMMVALLIGTTTLLAMRWFQVPLPTRAVAATAAVTSPLAPATEPAPPAVPAPAPAITPIKAQRIRRVDQLNDGPLAGRELDGRGLGALAADGTVLPVSLDGGILRVRRPDGGIGEASELQGLTLTGKLDDGSSVRLRVDAVALTDGDWARYTLSLLSDGQEPRPVCAHEGAPAAAFALAGAWDERRGVAGGGSRLADPEAITLACTGFALATCVELGYAPWRTTQVCRPDGQCQSVPLSYQHQACTRMLRGDYCGDGTAHGLQESVQALDALNASARQADDDYWPVEAEWGVGGARCLTQLRWTSADAPSTTLVSDYVLGACPNRLARPEQIASCGNESAADAEKRASTPLEQQSLFISESDALRRAASTP